MTHKFLNKKNRKYLTLLCICLCGILLQGCAGGNIRERVYEGIGKLVHGSMAGAATNCYVYSVDGMTGAHRYICENSTGKYIYHNNAICDYETMEEIVQVENLESMACNEDALFYSVTDGGGKLYRYEFSEGESELLTDEYKVVSMKGCGDDVFVSQRQKNEYNHETEDNKAYDLIYYHKAEAGIPINDWMAEHTEKETADEYQIYEFEGYQIAADKTINENSPQPVFIEKEDDFQYSCYGYHVYGKMNENYIRLSRDVTCRYLGREEEIPEILEASEVYAGLSPAQTGFFGDKVYCLVQYSRTQWGYQENPSVDLKLSDAFFEYSPETGECSMKYQIQEKEQIAGFSYGKKCLYLLRNDGVYEYDWETGNETLAFENEGYERLAFEYVDDKLFIFREAAVEYPVELLAVIE